MAALMVASAVLSAYAAIKQGQAQKSAANYNAEVAGVQAQVAREQGNANEETQRRRAGLALGRQAAGAAENGGLSGTNLDLYQQSATDAELDALNIRYGSKLAGSSADAQAGMYRSQASQAMPAAYLNAGAAALSAYGSYAMASGGGQYNYRGSTLPNSLRGGN